MPATMHTRSPLVDCRERRFDLPQMRDVLDVETNDRDVPIFGVRRVGTDTAQEFSWLESRKREGRKSLAASVNEPNPFQEERLEKVDLRDLLVTVPHRSKLVHAQSVSGLSTKQAPAPPESAEARYRCGRFAKLRPRRMEAKTLSDGSKETLDQMVIRSQAEAAAKDPCNFQEGHKQDALIMGLSARVGASTTTLQHKPAASESGEPADPVAREASIFHATFSILLTSRTFKTEDGGEYQFGLEFGKTFRRIGGDASADAKFLSKPDVFGHPRTNLGGIDATFFARLNGFQPFVRVAQLSRGGGPHVAGLTGVQASIGVNVLSSLFQTTKEARAEGERDPK